MENLIEFLIFFGYYVISKYLYEAIINILHNIKTNNNKK